MAEENDIRDALAQSDKDEFHAIRGLAIQAYAMLEQSLCSVFSRASDTKRDVAGIIFFRIANFNVRLVIIEKLLKRRRGDAFSVFWGSLEKRVRSLSNRRNEIVHWTVAVETVKYQFSKNSLVPPNYWFVLGTEGRQSLDTNDLRQFAQECDFVGGLLHYFHLFIGPEPEVFFHGEEGQTWREIFQQEVIYPPPSNHPLIRISKEYGSQPPPSPESQQP